MAIYRLVGAAIALRRRMRGGGWAGARGRSLGIGDRIGRGAARRALLVMLMAGEEWQ